MITYFAILTIISCAYSIYLQSKITRYEEIFENTYQTIKQITEEAEKNETTRNRN